MFIARGADVVSANRYPLPVGDPVSREGITPLMYAALNRDIHYAAILIDSGADKTSRDAKGFTALDHARHSGAGPELLRLLTHGILERPPVAHR